MDIALIGLIGSIIAALATIIGILISSQHKRKQWVSEKKHEAYTGALRSLYRLINRRSEFDSNGRAFISKDDVKGWFDDYIESQTWIAQIASYSPSIYHRYKIEEKNNPLKQFFLDVASGTVQLLELGDKEKLSKITWSNIDVNKIDIKQFLMDRKETQLKGGSIGFFVRPERMEEEGKLMEAKKVGKKAEYSLISVPELANDLVTVIIEAARNDLKR